MGALLRDLPQLPFHEQRDLLERALAAGRIEEALRATAGLPDPEPLAHVVLSLDARGAFADPEGVATRTLAALFGGLGDVSLRALLLRAPGLSEAGRERLFATAEASLFAFPIARIVALAWVARWLRDRAPERYARALERARAKISDDPSKISELEAQAAIALLSGRELEALASDPRWSARARRTLEEALAAIAEAPKSLSQANAEEILAHRVYAQQGHFFFELMQNAEDAGARTFSVVIEPGQLRILHDGAPFSLRDVVGVLSIGQSQKDSTQIGFFGVGFKSVYEITERPRVASGLFRFEIAQVSIPRPLLGPTGAEAEACAGTTELILPYAEREGEPPPSPARLFEQARRIPAETLLTLRHLERFSVRLEANRGEAGPAEERAYRIEREGDRARLIARHTGEEARYALGRATARDRGGLRESRKAKESELLIALALDARGRPTPLAGPTVFAHLPTAEPSGLALLLHGGFDVTVDRERLEERSPWNALLLREAGALLARLAEELAEELGEPGGQAALELLPRRRDLREGFEELWAGFAAEAQGRALFFAQAGGRLRPGEARSIASAPLRAALAEVELPGRALAALSPHALAVAHDLGARPFGPADLLALLERALEDHPEGVPPPTSWLRGGLVVALTALAEWPDLASHASALRALPLLADEEGRLRRAASLALPEASLRPLYRGLRPLLAEALDAPALAPLLALLEPARIGETELLADLRDERGRTRLTSDAKRPLLYARLGELRPAQLAPLGALPLARCEDGRDRPVIEAAEGGPEGRAWLAPPGRLGRALRGLGEGLFEAEIFLLEAQAQRQFTNLFNDMGASVFGLEEILEALAEGRLLPAEGPAQSLVEALHEVLGEERASLGQGTLSLAARAPIFRDRRGAYRPLRGPGRALVASDPDLPPLLPELPWLDPRQAILPHLAHPRHLGVEAQDASSLARALGGQDELGLGPAAGLDTARLPALYRYLGERAAQLSGRESQALARSSIWLSTEGGRFPLAALRRPSASATVGAFYRALSSFSLAAEESLTFAEALGHGALLGSADHAQAISDLLRVDLEPVGALREPIHALLREAAGLLSAATLAPLAERPLFADEHGALRKLGELSAHPALRDPRDRCVRASAALHGLVRAAGYPLLSAEDEASLGPLLDHLPPRPAGLEEAILLLEREPAFRAAEGAALARRALGDLLSPKGRELDPEPLRARLSAIPLWPGARESGAERGGPLLPSRALCTRADLRRALGAVVVGDPGSAEGLLAEVLLAESAEEEASSLRPFFEFLSPGEALRRTVFHAARPGEALEAQPALLSSREGLLAALRASLEAGLDLDPLPLRLDALGRLRREPLFVAGPEEQALAEGLPLLGALADPEWARAAAALAPSLLEPLPPRRLLAAIAEVCEEDASEAAHPYFGDPEESERYPLLDAWLLDHREAIAGSEEAKKVLGRAAIVPAEGGRYASPRALLLDPDLPDLELGWGASERASRALVAFLHGLYGPEEGAMQRMVDFLIAGIDQAAREEDRGRAADLTLYLARAFAAQGDRSGDLETRARRHKLPRRLKIETSEGSFGKPRRLLMPEPSHLAWIEAFLRDPPERVHRDRYHDPAVRALLVASGAVGELEEATVEAALEGQGRRPGREASVALALYAIHRADREPRLRDRWKLASRAFVPDGLGALRRAEALCWPSPRLYAVLGRSPSLYPTPELVHGAPEGARAWLRFRDAEGLTLEDLAARLEEDPAEDEERLAWLEEGLEKKRLEKKKVRAALEGRLLLRGRGGRLWPPGKLLRSSAGHLFGARREVWERADRFPRLASAFQIVDAPRRAHVLSYLEEVGAELEARGEALLDAEPELARTLLACLEWLVLREEAPPPRLPLVCVLRGETVLRMSDAEGVARPEPFELAEEVEEEGWPIALPLLPAGNRGATLAFLDAMKVPSLYAALGRAEPEEGPRGEGAGPRGSGEASSTSSSEERAKGPGLFARIGRWLRGGEGEEPRRARGRGVDPRRETQASNQERFFQPREHIGAQLDSALEWLEDRKRAPHFGLNFEPGRLDLPWLYAPQLTVGRFDRRSQRWEGALPRPPEPSGALLGQVALRGELPAGEVLLPLPMYASFTRIEAEGQATQTQRHELLMVRERPGPVRLRIGLHRAPAFDEAEVEAELEAGDPDLLRPTVPDEELPDEALDMVEEARRLPPFERALAVRLFVRERYRYDPSYLEDPSVARWLRQLSEGSPSVHLAALHAGRDARHLGRGVCYELNVLACELMRRAGIPSAIASGWVFDGGTLSEPDHLWAVALFTVRGAPAPFPIDASTTAEGRPLRVAHRPPGPWRVAQPDDPPPEAPGRAERRGGSGRPEEPERAERAKKAKAKKAGWRKERREREDRRAPEAWRERVRASEPKAKRKRRVQVPAADLLRVLRYVERLSGRELEGEALLERCRELLADPEKAKALLKLLDE